MRPWLNWIEQQISNLGICVILCGKNPVKSISYTCVVCSVKIVANLWLTAKIKKCKTE